MTLFFWKGAAVQQQCRSTLGGQVFYQVLSPDEAAGEEDEAVCAAWLREACE